MNFELPKAVFNDADRERQRATNSSLAYKRAKLNYQLNKEDNEVEDIRSELDS